jgi:hypothetical protein
MDVENLAKELILKNMTPEQQMAVLDSVRQSVLQAKEVQKKKIGENVDLVVQALKKIEYDITTRFESVGNSIEKRVLSIKDGRDGSNGNDGRDGKDGKSGKDGLRGERGVDGQAGRDGVDGVDGVSVVNANIDFDGSLIISLSDGREINVGEVVSADVAEKIKVISTMSTNAAIAIKDEGTSLTSSVKTINFVGAVVTATNSGDDVTVNVSSGTGTVTSVAATGGTGISVSGSPITTSGTLTITNTAPDQTVVLTAGTGINTSGTYPSFTVTNSAPDQTVALTAGTGISTSGTYPNFTITNSAPDQTVALTQGGTTTITGTYPNFTISSADQFQGTVTSVTGTSPVASSGGATPAISLASGYGDTLNPYASKTANYVLAAPDGSAGAPTFRAIAAADIPTLNQNTTGSAATLTTPRAIYGNNFDGSAALTQVIASTYGGTGNGFTKFTGATTAEKTYTLPDASSTIVVQGGALGTPSSGTVTNLTGTASININGTVGATTASSGAFTTLSATGVTTVQAGTAALPAITTTGDTNTGIFFPAADTIAFAEGGAEAMRIDSSGNVGINTTSTAAKFQTNSTDGTIAIFRTTSGANNGRLNIDISDSAATAGFAVGGNSSFPAMTFANGGAERMRIDSSGNVGIGTTSVSSSTKLEVYGNVAGHVGLRVNNASTSGYSTLWLSSVGGNDGIIRGGSAAGAFTEQLAMLTGGATPITFTTNSVERMRIDSSGNLLVGTTTALGASGAGCMSIVSANSNGQINFRNSGASGVKQFYVGANSSNQFRVYNDAGSGVLLTDGSTSWSSTSDERVKDIIEPISNAASKVSTLRAVVGKYKKDEEGIRRSFLIAQDLQVVFPEAVDSSNPDELGIRYTEVIPLLVAAIQEQQALITALTARITALENK